MALVVDCRWLAREPLPNARRHRYARGLKWFEFLRLPWLPPLLPAAPRRPPPLAARLRLPPVVAARSRARPAPKPQYGAFGFDTAGMDPSVAPGDDFFGYANGTWARNTPIPADKSRYGMFNVLDDLSRERTRDDHRGAGQGSKQPDRQRLCELHG